MANTQEPELDEVVWRAPQIAQTMGGIHTNTILPYFAESPFFDATSNNAVISNQALYRAEWYPLLQTRVAFEGQLRKMQGLEFMVTQDPSENGTKVDNSGVWVIRKQNRRKGKMNDGSDAVITPITSYFVVGENVYMAPTVGSILDSRLLSTVSCLTKLLTTASPLPLFTPSIGHTYFPPTSKPFTAAASTQPTQSSKDSTPMPGTQDSAAGSKAPLSTTRSTPNSEQSALQTLSESLNLCLTYGSEYMDSSPLVGEPGSFRVTKPKEVAPKPVVATATPFKAQPPEQIQTTGLPKEIRKGSKGGEKSPITPGTATKDKKGRRKSKAAGATGTATTTPK